MKIVVSARDGKSYCTDIPKDREALLYHKKIGDEIEGSIIGLAGYTLKITGGSDDSGFPMRYDIEGNRKLKVYLSKGPGYKPKRKGVHRKKTLRGNEVGQSIQEINVIIVKEGAVKITDVLGSSEKKQDTEKKEKTG